ncbi:hypothetical protein GEMRC1_009457 [Eukaryota sp. GEM-RC1]
MLCLRGTDGESYHTSMWSQLCRDKCLVVWMNQKAAASCPVCREPIPSSPLRVNIALREAIEIAKNPQPDSILCFECEEAAATLFCTDCDAHHCDPCSSSIHRSKTLRRHTVVSLGEEPDLITFKCPRHPTKPLEHFCTKCMVSICDSCGLLMGHAEHWQSLIPLSQAKEDFELQVKELHLSLSNASSTVSGTKEEVEKVVAEVLANTQTILHDLINNLVSESSQKILDLDTGNTITLSLPCKVESRDQIESQGQEEFRKALTSLKRFNKVFIDSIRLVERQSLKFSNQLTCRLLNQELDSPTSVSESSESEYECFENRKQLKFQPSVIIEDSMESLCMDKKRF